jgi:hypothetical protein
MKIEREILGIEVTIHFDDYGNVEEIEVDSENLEILNENAIDFNNQSQELVTNYFDGLREEAEDIIFERKRGY